MTRSDNLAAAFLDTGGEVKGIRFSPISWQRRNILERRRNTLLDDNPDRDQTEAEGMAEILFVLSRSKEQNMELFHATAEEWDRAVAEFLIGLEDGTLEEFRDSYVLPAREQLRAAAAESEAAGKYQPSPTAPLSSSPTPTGSGWRPKPSFGASPPR